MKKIFLICGLLLLSACAGTGRPEYIYENSHKIDNQLNNDNVCLVIDTENSTIKNGHQNLSIDPFLGQQGYNPENVEKKQYIYDTKYNNPNCEKPIKIKRQIELSSISYPGTCYGKQYAGSIYTGATSSLTSYGTINTNISSVPMYNSTQYSCIKTQYYTSIDFYNGKTLVGNIKNNGWSNYSNIDDTIRYYTKIFLKKIQAELPKKK